jgi:predicted MFS family arabinose efflux permease
MAALHPSLRALRPALPILIGASVMLSLSMGLRQSLGLFMQPLTRDVHISISDFTLAIAVQNLAWGFLQPVAGALTPRFGFRPIMVLGAITYVAGLVALAGANGLIGVMIGAGILIGASLACTASALAMSVSARAVSAQLRSLVFGIVSAAGSIGAMIAAPIGQALSAGYGWRVGVVGFVALACIMIPAAWFAGRADKIPEPPPLPGGVDDRSAGQAFVAALKNGPFMVIAIAFFVCGLQLVFLTTHLPTYLALCGMDPMLSAEALGVIGGFNVLGSLFFGWAGGRWNKLVLLGGVYILRSAILGAYFFWPPTPGSTLVFAALMGFTWLGVVPLVAGAVAEMFGLRWQAMIQGIAFVGHQVGSFVGAFGGGLLYDALGSYDLAWRLAVATGLLAGAVQIASALMRPTRPPAVLAPA